MSDSRQKIEETLRSRPWFQATSEELQKKLLGLPENCNGFLEHTAHRPEEGGGVRVKSLHSLLLPELPGGVVFGLFPAFNVEKPDGTTFTYQYFSWKQGPASGVKGVVLIKGADGSISHVVCLNGFSFAVGPNTFDCVGGFAEINEEGIGKLVENAKREITEELGLQRFELQKVIRLGPMHVDRGMTPNCPQLFAAIIDGSDAKGIKEDAYVNPDPHEMEAGAKIVPVKALWGEHGFLMRNTDSFFGTCIARLVALGVLKP